MGYESYQQIRARLEKEARRRGYVPGGAAWDRYVEGTFDHIKRHRSAKWRRIFARSARRS